MKRERLNTLAERDILIGLITSYRFCREICPIIVPKYLEIDYTRIVVTWIKGYYSKFGEAPKRNMMKLYRSHVEELKDEDLQENILEFINKINSDYQNISNFNDEFALEQAISYLKGRSLKNLASNIDAYVSTGEIDKAETALTKFKRVERANGESASILNNTEEIIDTFTSENNILFQFKGAYGKVIGVLHREDFFAYVAPIKRGKTYHLMYTAETAMMQGLKVVFFSLEMSREQMIKRFWTSLSGQLAESKDDIMYPYFDVDDDGTHVVKHKLISRRAVDTKAIEKKQKQIKQMTNGGDIQIVAVPAYSLTVEALETYLDDFEQNGYVADVIIVDYADIMCPSEKGDYRNQLDGIWKRLRGLAQKKKALVVTASQSGRGSIDRDVDATDIAEDIRKIAHVTSMVSLNQTPNDVKHGVMKVKQLAIREGEREFRQAVCLQCLTIGRPVLDSYFDDEVRLDYIREEKTEEKPGRPRKD